MSEHDERVEALARVIAEAWANDSDLPPEADPYDEAPEFFDDVARHLLDSPAVRDLLAAERAKGLREAADTLERFGFRSVVAVLRARADRIHPADLEETR